jgi:hypothetical protein
MTIKNIETAETLRYRKLRFEQPRVIWTPGSIFMLVCSLFALAVFVWQIG